MHAGVGHAGVFHCLFPARCLPSQDYYSAVLISSNLSDKEQGIWLHYLAIGTQNQSHSRLRS